MKLKLSLSLLVLSGFAVLSNQADANSIFGNGSESFLFTLSGTITGESSDDWGNGSVNFSSPHYPPVVGEKFSIVFNSYDYDQNLYWMTFRGQAPIRGSFDASSAGISIFLRELYGPPDYWFSFTLLTSNAAFDPRIVGSTDYCGSYFDLTNHGSFHDSGVTPYFGQGGLASRNIGFQIDNLSIVYATPDSGPNTFGMSVIILTLFAVRRRKVAI